MADRKHHYRLFREVSENHPAIFHSFCKNVRFHQVPAASELPGNTQVRLFRESIIKEFLPERKRSDDDIRKLRYMVEQYELSDTKAKSKKEKDVLKCENGK